MKSDNEVIAVRGLAMHYGNVRVFDDVDLCVHRGEVVALLGPNGAGKSTTVEILEGFRPRSAGAVSVLGTDPATGDDAWSARLGVVLQSWCDHATWRDRRAAVSRRAHRRPGSPGAPGLPRPGAPSGQRFRTTVLITTHDLWDADALATRIAILVAGRVIASGRREELTHQIAGADHVAYSLHGRRHEERVADATGFMRDLLARHGEAVTELGVRPASLEDTYLAYVHHAETNGDPREQAA